MPLNTQPLDPNRRALMVTFLLVCFVGSLGFAQWISYSRHSSLALSVLFPAELSDPVKNPVPGLYDAREGLVEGQPRQLYYFFYDHVPQVDPAMIKTEATRLFVEVVGESPSPTPPNIAPLQSTLARRAAAEIENLNLKNGGFAILRFTIFADRAVGVLYSGSGEVTDVDEKLYYKVTHELRVIDMKARARARITNQGN